MLQSNNCYYYWDLHSYLFHIYLHQILCHSHDAFLQIRYFKFILIVKEKYICFSVINFQDTFIRQLSYYALLSRCQLPWPLCCCLYESIPFRSLISIYIGHFSFQLTVHPTLPVMLTKTRPTYHVYSNLMLINTCLINIILLPIQSLRIS
jgi:hypothetical protein